MIETRPDLPQASRHRASVRHCLECGIIQAFAIAGVTDFDQNAVARELA